MNIFSFLHVCFFLSFVTDLLLFLCLSCMSVFFFFLTDIVLSLQHQHLRLINFFLSHRFANLHLRQYYWYFFFLFLFHFSYSSFLIIIFMSNGFVFRVLIWKKWKQKWWNGKEKWWCDGITNRRHETEARQRTSSAIVIASATPRVTKPVARRGRARAELGRAGDGAWMSRWRSVWQSVWQSVWRSAWYICLYM